MFVTAEDQSFTSYSDVSPSTVIILRKLHTVSPAINCQPPSVSLRAGNQ